MEKITAEIMRVEEETERFIEQTKKFENNLKSVERKDVKVKAVCQISKEKALA